MKVAFLRALKLLMLLAIIGGAILIKPWQHLPPQWNPWEPLAVDHPMTMVSKWKLSQLADSPEQCLAVLETAPDGAMNYMPLEDYTPVAGCPLSNVVRVARTSVSYNASFTVTCPLAVTWLMFERQELQPLAQKHFASELQRVEHFGSFACRNIYHRESARRSQHAFANAFDVAGFRFADGTRVTVLGDWDNQAAPQKSAFLKEVHANACDYFSTVLGPDYNQPHENHFHFEAGGFGICR